jgi:putative ABC transport system permease protein
MPGSGWLLALLRRATDAELADSIVGDLEEERRRIRNPIFASMWYWREAAAVVVRAIGERIADALRDSSGASFITGSPGDLRYAFRSLGANPWYAGTVIGVIALSMALATTVFAVVDGVLFKPLPYDRSNELYLVTGGYQKSQRNGISVAPRNLRDWAAASPDARIATFRVNGGEMREGDLRAWAPSVAEIDAQFLDVLGVRPLIGGFSPDVFESKTDVTPALISYDLWQSAMAGRPDVVGQTLLTPGATRGYRVLGVLPASFVFPANTRTLPNVLVPVVVPPEQRDSLRYRLYEGIARLSPSRPLAEYQARMDAAAVAEAVDWVPRKNDGSPVFDRVGLQPLETVLTEQQRPLFLTIFSVAAALVLLGCLNVSGLMASRADDRWRELAIRRALGGNAAVFARLVLSESLVIVTAGVLLGLAWAGPFLATTLRLLPASVGLLKLPTVDARVLVFAGLSSALVILLVSCWPAWRSLRVTTGPSNRGSQAARGRRSLGTHVIIATQVAMGLALTLGGALLVGSLVQLWQTDPGFDAGRVVILEGFFRDVPKEDRLATLISFQDRVRAIGDVASVGAVQGPVLRQSMLMNAFTHGQTCAITPGFFDAIGLTLRDGRLITDDEIRSGAPVVVLSERSAARAFPGERALGRTIRGYHQGSPMPFTVVGVVADARLTSWDSASRSLGQIYASYVLAADEQPRLTIVVRAKGAPENLVGVLTAMASREQGTTRISSIATAEVLLSDTVKPRRLNAWIFGVFASAALAIVAVGVLGLLAMNAARRRREIGIRLALGATRRRVLGLLLREQTIAVGLGLAGGALASYWAVQSLKTYMYQLTVYDLRLWTVAVVVMLTGVATAALIPSWRVTRIDPAETLRAE